MPDPSRKPASPVPRACLVVCVALVVAACDFAAVGAPVNRGKTMKSMNCTAVKAQEIQRAVLDAQTRKVYRPAPGSPTTVVRFEVFLPGVQAAAEKETLMVVHSGRLDTAVYAGPYTEQFSVVADESLTRDHGADTLRFEYYRKALGQICFWEQDRVEPYWQPDSTVKVRFLEGRQVDERTGRALAFVVRVDAKR
jgi:hypothetical protein